MADSKKKQPPSCFDKAVDLLARRAHFRLELERKLTSRGYDSLEIEGAIDRLFDLGYLDERTTAEHYVAGRLRRGDFGPRRLVAELRQRGVDGDLAGEIVREKIGDEAELARRAADRWLRIKAGRATPAALARHLERAGFSSSLVWEELRRFEADSESSAATPGWEG